MVILGAKGHAFEVLDVLEKNNLQEEIIFFDNISMDSALSIPSQYKLIRDNEELKHYFKNHPTYVIATGGTSVRRKLCVLGENLGGVLTSVVSKFALIGNHKVVLGKGINIMHNTLISSNVRIGKGSLINAGSNIHHDVHIGDFCEICPNVTITGHVTIANNVFVGTGATILPNVTILDNAIVGAGAVVTADVAKDSIVKGVPGK